MDKSDTRPRQLTIRELSGPARSDAQHSLDGLLAKQDPITPTLLSEFASGSDNRAALLLGSVWGTIRWPKALGRPRTPSISGGFILIHEFQDDDRVDLGGGRSANRAPFRVMPAPNVWDGSSGPDHRVGFYFFAGDLKLINKNRVTVKLAPVAWDFGPLVSPGTLRLDPYAFGTFGTLGERVFLPEVTVRHDPYHRAPFVQPLGPSVPVPGPSPR